MSVPVAVAELAEHMAERGTVAHLVTVRPEGRPHVVAVTPWWQDGRLAVSAGHRTSANVAGHPQVTLVWAALPGTGYSLIVDGTVSALPPGEAGTLVIEPDKAVLHRTPEGDPADPSCVTVLPPP